MDESTTTDAATSAEPTTTDTGPTPDPEPKPNAKVPDEAYVRALRKEAADNRKALEAATKQLQEIKDRDKTDLEKLTERVTASESRATVAEAKLLQLEIAAERKLPASAVQLLHGTTREEIIASADALAAVLKEKETAVPDFDGGARNTAPESKSPELAHNDWLLRAIGRTTQP